MAQLTVDTLSLMYTDTGLFVFGPHFNRERSLNDPTYTGTDEVSQVIVQRQEGKPESPGSQLTPVVYANLAAADFDRLEAAVIARKAGDKPVTFEWTVGEYDFLTSFSYRL